MEKPDVDHDRRPVARDRHRAADRRSEPALDGRHHDRDLRLPAAPLRTHRASSTARSCGRPIEPPDRRGDGGPAARALEPGTQLALLAPLVRGRKGEHREVLEEAAPPGLPPRAHRRRDRRSSTATRSRSTRSASTTIEIVVDRLTVEPAKRSRLHDSLEAALRTGGGLGVGRVARRGARSSLAESARLHECGTRPRGARAAQLLLQQPLWRMPGVRGLGTQSRDRSRSRCARSRAVDPTRARSSRGRRRRPSGIRTMFETLARHSTSRSTRRSGGCRSGSATLLLHGSGKQELEFSWKSKRTVGRASAARSRA